MGTDPAYTPDPSLDSFERYLRAANGSDRTIANYLVSMEQTDRYLRQQGTTLLDARRADLEASWSTCSPASGRALWPRATRSSSSSVPGGSAGHPGIAGLTTPEPHGLDHGSMVTGRPAAVCHNAVRVDHPGVGTAAAGE